MPEFSYEDFSKQAESDLTKVKMRGFELIKAMLEAEDDGELYGIDFFFFGITDKSSFLIDGVKNCIKEKNLIVLGLLLRTQIDNCLRAFALTLVNEPHELSMKVLGGESLRNIADKDGKKMTDKYLREKLSAIDNKISPVYEAACGYVHFSDKGMLHALKALKSPSIGISVGRIRDEDLVLIQEGYYAFLHFTSLLYEKELGSWIITKKRVGQSKRKKV